MSSQAKGEQADLSAIRDGASSAADSRVAHAELLISFAEALVARDEPELAKLRPRLIDALGPEGFLETASVAANFQRMVRIADGTGIPQDAPVVALAGSLVDELSLRDFPSAENTPKASLLQRLAGRLLKPIAPKLLSLMDSRTNPPPPTP